MPAVLCRSRPVTPALPNGPTIVVALAGGTRLTSAREAPAALVGAVLCKLHRPYDKISFDMSR